MEIDYGWTGNTQPVCPHCLEAHNPIMGCMEWRLRVHVVDLLERVKTLESARDEDWKKYCQSLDEMRVERDEARAVALSLYESLINGTVIYGCRSKMFPWLEEE